MRENLEFKNMPLVYSITPSSIQLINHG